MKKVTYQVQEQQFDKLLTSHPVKGWYEDKQNEEDKDE